MRDRSAIPWFEPTEAWRADWPYGVSTLVRVLASVTGAAKDRAVDRFLAPLVHNPDADVAPGVRLYYWGGFIAECTPPAGDGPWQILLASAGEDGFDSLLSAADDLAEAVRATPGDIRLTWRELPALRAD